MKMIKLILVLPLLGLSSCSEADRDYFWHGDRSRVSKPVSQSSYGGDAWMNDARARNAAQVRDIQRDQARRGVPQTFPRKQYGY
ncbi:hypothetical protein NT6N_25840 [Oceaniferula spumae]|uniref:Lipoprotein n=1 Tax=Oceaniferula spumae TaxID=2979115 RepID=A0AAT9FNL8_9BACT